MSEGLKLDMPQRQLWLTYEIKLIVRALGRGRVVAATRDQIVRLDADRCAGARYLPQIVNQSSKRVK